MSEKISRTDQDLAASSLFKPDGNIIKHPDLHARDLVMRSVQYFDDVGTEIHTIEFNWFPEKGQSDNYVVYMSHLPTGEEPTEEQYKQAVFSTWSGKLALELGFTEIISIR